MNRYIRMRRSNNGSWDTLFPQGVTDNILRREDGGVLENYLVDYDYHLINNTRHFNHAVTTNIHHPNLSTHRYLDVNIENAELVDGFPLLLTTHTKVDAEPMLSFNGGEYYPIVSASGNRIPGGQIAGTTILLVWNENLQSWILLSTSDTNDITKIAVPSYTEYTYTAQEDGEKIFVVPGFDKTSCALEVNYGQTLLRQNRDYGFQVGRRDTIELKTFELSAGDVLFFKITSYEVVMKSSATVYDIEVGDYDLIATTDNQATLALPPAVQKANVIELNYVQTVLRNGIDYEFNADKSQVTLKEFTLEKDEVIVAHITTLIEHDATTLPRQWNVPGAYTYEIKTVHGSFTSTEDSTNVIPIPDFDQTRDELVVIKDNKVLVYDVDYEIDKLNQVVLQDEYALDTGDTLHYTIFQGAIQDVPPFVVVQDKSENGQHLLLDFSYALLRDGFTAVIKLSHKLVSVPTIKCLDGPAESILDNFGAPITGGYIAGSYLWCIYDEKNHVWYSMSHGHYDVSESYGSFEFAEGDANFLGNDTTYMDLGDDHYGELVIPHGLSTIPTDIEIHPTGHPGFLICPYEKPLAGINPGAAGDNVRWVQWGLWNLGYVNETITLENWVTGRYDDRTQAAIEKWQFENGLEVKEQFDNEAIDLMASETSHIRCTIGDTWASADATNIYVGNSGNSTSTFHWVATTSNGNLNFKQSIDEAVTELVEMIKTYPGNFYTRTFNFTSPAENTYDIPVEDYVPGEEKIYLVNYGQTVLREGVDYNLTDTGVELIRMRLPTGAVVQVVLVKQGSDD